MKIIFFFLLLGAVAYAQEDDPLLSDTDNTGASIPLYQIDLDNIKIPIMLEYNNTGIKVQEVPGPLGVSWKLNDIGKITHIVNHLPDDYTPAADYIEHLENTVISSLQQYIPSVGGWFISPATVPNNMLGTYDYWISESNSYNTQNYGSFFNGNIDCVPDYFLLNTATGLNSTFLYKKNFNGSTLLDPSPLMLESNQKLKIATYFDNLHYRVLNTTDVAFDFTTEEGNLRHSFIGGPPQYTINRSGQSPYAYKNYYLSKISSVQNIDVVDIEYIVNEKFEYIQFATGVKHPANDYAGAASQDNGLNDVSTLEVKKITTPKEVIEFFYSGYLLDSHNTITPDDDVYVKQLSRIEVRNKANELVTGYTFQYQIFDDNRFILSKIYQLASNGIDTKKLWGFEYYAGSPNEHTSHYYDMFNYSIKRASTGSWGFPIPRKACSVGGGGPITPGTDRSPDFNGILCGMLKKITNSLGGTKEFTYQLNEGEVTEQGPDLHYGGGLKVASVTETPAAGQSKTTRYTYLWIKGKRYRKAGAIAGAFMAQLPNIGYGGGVDIVYNSPLWFDDDYPEGPDPNLYPDYDTHVAGSYFEKVIASTFYEMEGDREIYLNTVSEFVPSWTGVIRRPLLKKRTVYKTYYYNGEEEGAVPISQEERDYQLLSSYRLDAVSNIRRQYSSCDHTFGYIFLERKPIYIFQQPLRRIINKEYLLDEFGSSSAVVETRKEFKYFGDYNNGYEIDPLRPKEVITYKNNTPISKKKFTYLCEMFRLNAGLEALNEYNSPQRTLLFSESDWVYNKANKWILDEAEFYFYAADGKLDRYSRAHKNHNNNTDYDESTYNPYFSGGSLTNISPENRVILGYDSNGRLSSVKDYDNADVVFFKRSGDRDPYSVNTLLKAKWYEEGFTLDYSFMRTSFEATSSNVLVTPLAYTGKKVYTGSIYGAGTFPTGHIVSFWYYKDGGWKFSSYTHPGGIVSISLPSGALYMDEVWVRPPNTVLTGYTFEPLVGKTFTIDDNGLVLKTIYDLFGREVKQVDQDNNLIQTKEYNLIED